MPSLHPFRAVRPTRDKVHLVASRSYVSYTAQQLRSKLTENPFSFLHIIHPDMTATNLHKTADLGERFKQVRKRYESFLEEGILQRDEKPALYIYRQIKQGHAFTGIIGAVSVDDYLNGRIKVHEKTIAKREETFVHYLDVTRINAEPVLLMAKDSKTIDDLIAEKTAERPEYDFTTTNKVHHQFWVIDDETVIQNITEGYAHSDAFYIADGHHRSSSSALLFEKHKASISNENDPMRYCLAYILSEENVRIYEFNRIVKDLNGLSKEELLSRLEASFTLEQSSTPVHPHKKGELGMYLEKKWYKLHLKEASDVLDVQLVTDLILAPIFGISDLRKDKRIAFMEGPKGLDALCQAVDKQGTGAAFTLFAPTVSDIKRIADAGETMPPKSTWVEPKLRSGLVVYEL
ncbi:MAG: DUF1015 domain-containing protein [Flavobacteriales bacterium]